MKKAKVIIRILLGVILVVFGLNKLLQFMPIPPMSVEASAFMAALVESGYILPIVAIVEVITGIMLLFNKYQALALVVLFPVLLNSFLFHLFLDTAGIGGAAMATAINVFLLYVNKESYSQIFKS